MSQINIDGGGNATINYIIIFTINEKALTWAKKKKAYAKIPKRVDNFKKLIEEAYLFVDHTQMIQAFVEEGNELSLDLRPRRWGRSLPCIDALLFSCSQLTRTRGTIYGLKIASFDDGILIILADGYMYIAIFFCKLKGIWQ